MNNDRFHRLIEFLAGIEPVVAVCWIGLIFFTVGLAVLMYTRWGQYRPLRKCMGLSLLVHLILASYATTIHIAAPLPQPPEQVVNLSLGDGPAITEDIGGAGSANSVRSNEQPWETFGDDPAVHPRATELERGAIGALVEPKRLTQADRSPLPGNPALDHVAWTESQPFGPDAAARSGKNKNLQTATKPAAAIEAPAAQRRDAACPTIPDGAASAERFATDAPGRPVRISTEDVPVALLQQAAPLPPMDESEMAGLSLVTDHAINTVAIRIKPSPRIAANAADSTDDDDSAYAAGKSAGDGESNAESSGRFSAPSVAGLTSTRSDAGGHGNSGGELAGGGTAIALAAIPRRYDGNAAKASVPDAYRLRVAPNRSDIAQSHGGTAETEAAVKAALKWLADNQSADGRWDPRVHGAGKETNVLGRDRQNAGSKADSAVTGLALLAFLAAGHTHLDGPYRQDVRRGLEYLVRIQAADGNLAGQAASFEFMYSHAMATFALSEAYGMTHDARLREPVGRAIGYTVRAQDSMGGGWRYRPGDAGDTSQLGWQLMALKSAELAGIPIPDSTRQGIIRYLQSVASGDYGGRASYRPGEQTTRTMTAEALVCWQFLGLPRQNPACNEAGDFLLGELPGDGMSNLYYWYYGTLGMYQLRGIHWQRWNEAMRKAVVGRQVHEGPQTGSWDTNDLWGGHGGRVYTTALATLTLEVYYRFLPLYAEAAPSEERAK